MQFGRSKYVKRGRGVSLSIFNKSSTIDDPIDTTVLTCMQTSFSTVVEEEVQIWIF